MNRMVMEAFDLGDRIRVEAEAQREGVRRVAPLSPEHGNDQRPLSPAQPPDLAEERDLPPPTSPGEHGRGGLGINGPHRDFESPNSNADRAHPAPPHPFQSDSEGSTDDEEMEWGDSDDETDISIAALEEAAQTPLFGGQLIRVWRQPT